MPTTDLIAELTWRGMVQDMMPGTAEQLAKEPTAIYIGFDPTAASLHIGNLATLILLVHVQRAGHKPVALVGGATGMVGDPSGKNSERSFLDEETLRSNQDGIKAQMAQFLDFTAKENPAMLVNNYDWFAGIGFLQFLREAGKHISVNYMMAKDSVKNRLETGISFTEFSYQLLQGYDFYYLWLNHGVKVQMGGSDQWGNMVTGTELIRRKANGEAYAITTPLVTKADGTKFGKSEKGNIWLDPALTSPYQFYQFWLNTADEEAEKLLKRFTLLTQEEIASLAAQQQEAAHLRPMQKALAEWVTRYVHGEEALTQAIEASSIIFGKASFEQLEKLDEPTLLDVFAGVAQASISAAQLAQTDVVSLISVDTEGIIVDSKGNAKKDIAAGAITVNGEKVAEAQAAASSVTLLLGKYIVVKRGKKNYFLITVSA